MISLVCNMVENKISSDYNITSVLHCVDVLYIAVAHPTRSPPTVVKQPRVVTYTTARHQC
jgi:hypothetical protein